MAKKESTNLYYIKGLDIEALVKKHLNEKRLEVEYDLNNPIEVILKKYDDETKKYKESTHQTKRSIQQEKTNKQFLPLLNKSIYLIHLICKKTIGNKKADIPLNASILQKIIGNDYKNVLELLVEESIIFIWPDYIVGKSAKHYSISSIYENSIENTITTNKSLINFISKERQLLRTSTQSISQSKLVDADENLIKKYNRVLSLLELKYKQDALHYIKTKIYLNKQQEDYYNNIYLKYLDKNNDYIEISSIDKNNRMYSILTSTPKSFRNLLNIKYSLDIKNSHPLLLSYYLIKEYNINNNIIKSINNINKSINNQYDNLKLRKELKNRVLKNNQNANIPIDVIEYIANTFRGAFWEDFINTNTTDNYLRADIKITLFKEVFYSKDRNTRYKPYAKLFKKKYPNVYKLINKYKPKGNEKAFSNSLMYLESEIFHEILKQLYKKRGCNALSIHDAIVLLDTKGSQKYTENDIEKVMLKVYSKYNLFPTISIEHYSLNKCKEELDRQIIDQPIINNLIEQIKSHCNENHPHYNKNAKLVLEFINKGYVEIIVVNEIARVHFLTPLYKII